MTPIVSVIGTFSLSISAVSPKLTSGFPLYAALVAMGPE